MKPKFGGVEGGLWSALCCTWDGEHVFFKERKPDIVKPFDTTKEGNWSKCLSVMYHLLWSVSYSSLISAVPVCPGAVSCMIVHSCLTHRAWEKAVSLPPPRQTPAVRRHGSSSVSVAGRGWFCGLASFSPNFLLSEGKTMEVAKDLVSRWIGKA